jgi:hypothetical protein
MACPSHRAAPRLRLGVALLLSLAVHAPLGLLLWRVPGGAEGEPARVGGGAGGDVTLSIGSPAPPRRTPRREVYLPVDVAMQARVMENPVLGDPPAPAGGGPAVATGPGGGGPAATPAPGGAGGGGGLGLFAAPGAGRSVVYVVDRSVSMGPSGALKVAVAELIAGLRRLPPTARFQVIAYNTAAPRLIINRRDWLLPADPETVEQGVRLVADLRAGGGTAHVNALCEGLKLRPDVLYFVTDADELTLDDVREVKRHNAFGTAIHVIELNRAAGSDPEGALRRLAQDNGGAYRRVAPPAS